MTPEAYFLKYAFPCARLRLARKIITPDEYRMLVRAVETDMPVEREFLESKFCDAVKALKKFNQDYWSVDKIRDYFWNHHEEGIDQTLPLSMRRLCMVLPGTLEERIEKAPVELDIKAEAVFKVKLEEGNTRVVVPLYKGAKVGDKVMVHYGFAVEKI